MENRPSSLTKLLVPFFGILLAPIPATAERGDICQRNAECRQHSENGVRLSEKKAYVEALREFQDAYAIAPASRLLLNIGRSLYRLNRPKEALEYYSRYRKAEPNIDADTEKTVKRYENDALVDLPLSGPEKAPVVEEPVPAEAPPLSRAAQLTPKLPIALVAGGGAFLLIGIGLGGAAIAAGRELSDRSNNFKVFNADFQSLDQRGRALDQGAIAFDVIGALALTAGAVWTGLWLYERKTGAKLIGRASGTGFAIAGVY